VKVDPGGLETTLVLLKPDAIERALVGRIIERFERKGLQIVTPHTGARTSTSRWCAT